MLYIIVMVANSAFANLFVQSAWPAVLYIAFLGVFTMWPSSTYFNIIPPNDHSFTVKKRKHSKM